MKYYKYFDSELVTVNFNNVIKLIELPNRRIRDIHFVNKYNMSKIYIYQMTQLKDTLDNSPIICNMNGGIDHIGSTISYQCKMAYSSDKWLYLNENQFNMRAFK